MDLSKITYNDISFMAFGEAQAVKQDIDKLIKENERLTSIINSQIIEIKGLKNELNLRGDK